MLVWRARWEGGGQGGSSKSKALSPSRRALGPCVLRGACTGRAYGPSDQRHMRPAPLVPALI
jgi:hypothetical protein